MTSSYAFIALFSFSISYFGIVLLGLFTAFVYTKSLLGVLPLYLAYLLIVCLLCLQFVLPLLSFSSINTEQVMEARLIGVIISGNFSIVYRVNSLMSVCAQRLYLLKLMRQQGLPQNQLKVIYTAVIQSRMSCVLPACDGLLKANLANKINVFLRKCYRCGYTNQCDTISSFIEQADSKFF
jgi:hypothetical protein